MSSSTQTMPASSASPIVQNLLNLRHLSPSSLDRLDACPLGWIGRYGIKAPEKKTSYQFLGLCVHATLDAIHAGRIDPHPQAAIDHFHDTWMNQRVYRTPVPWEHIDWDRRDPEKAKNQAQLFHDHGMELVQLYVPQAHRNIPARLADGSPTTEFQVSVPLADYGGRHFQELIGRIDLLTMDRRLLDFKTKGWTKLNRSDWDYTLQFESYIFMLEEMGIIQAPIQASFAQLCYGKGYEYDESVGGSIPAWKVDRYRQITLPRLVAQAEAITERVLNAKDPQTALFPDARKGKHCDWCSIKQGICPLFNP